MPICYVLPGFAGSTLWTGPLIRWLNYSDLVLGRFGHLELAADGVTPGGDHGIQCDPAVGSGIASFHGMVPSYYETLWECLVTNLTPHGYTVTEFPYDWRLRSATSATRLGMQIMGAVTAADPCTLVCHSMGGLVGLAAWKWLKSQGRENLIRRIVTLGTPFRGSYMAILEASLAYGTTTRYMYQANVAAVTIRVFPLQFLYVKSWTLSQICSWLLTFPGYYELLPYLSSGTNDPNIASVYDPAHWVATSPPSQAHLDYVVNTYQPAMIRADDMPPSNVLVCAAGYGLATPYQLISGDNINAFTFYTNSINLLYTTDGDDTVLITSAALSGYSNHLIPASHSTLPAQACYGLQIISWILDPYTAAPPAQPIPAPAGTPAEYASPLPYPQTMIAVPTPLLPSPPVGGSSRRPNPCC